MSEAANATIGFIQVLNKLYLSLDHGRNDQLGNPVSGIDRNRFLAMVDQDDANFTTVISIDGSGRIDHADPLT